jgi:hypothetical protein
MTQVRGIARGLMAMSMLVACALIPTRARAEMPDAIRMADYGVKGFALGAEIGLSIGYLTTGPSYEKEEWKRLVLGAGIGALGGLTLGMAFAISDTTRQQQAGYFMIRDGNYGALMGAAIGALAGALFWIDDGSGKDMLKGASIGALAGAGLGFIYGVVEASRGTGTYYGPRRSRWGMTRDHEFYVNLSPAPGPTGPSMAASLGGRF